MIKLLDILNELEIQPQMHPIKIGNKAVNKSTAATSVIKSYTWEEALNQKILSSITKNNAERFFGILGIKPSTVKVETNPNTRKSFYIIGHYKNEPIMIARRETLNPVAGQTKVYSKYKVLKLHDILGNFDYDSFNQALQQNFPPDNYFDINNNSINWTARNRDIKKWRKNSNDLYYTDNTKENILKALKIQP